MYQLIHKMLLSSQHILEVDPHLVSDIERLSIKAFKEKEENAQLTAQRILYLINTHSILPSWEVPVHHGNDPIIRTIKFILEEAWESSERDYYQEVLTDLPHRDNFVSWIKDHVEKHSSSTLHPIFNFLREKADLVQMKEFVFQETPLEMFFGDILAFMLPGVYGSIKIEFLKNYWDEVGHANDIHVHRNLRKRLMQQLHIPVDAHIQHFELLIREELELANMYLGTAMNKAKHSQLIGNMLATELMIPNRFQYSIDAFRRLRVEDKALEYLILHTSVDEVHAEDWLNHVVMPILERHSYALPEITFGIFRRLGTSVAVLDTLYAQLQKTI